jgi:phosphatidylserine/phosphatidylglycerophosphate/cardiolipin synthase-like enzyme
MNWFKKSQITYEPLSESNSILYDESTFYNRFKQDLLEAKQEVIIESPFIATRRLEILKPIIERLVARGVQIFVMTRLPHEHDEYMSEQAEDGIRYFEALGVQVLLCEGGHHRKLAMIDRKVLWEGSLNILSQSHSREFMRRIESRQLTEELFKFLKFEKLNIFKEKLDLL